MSARSSRQQVEPGRPSRRTTAVDHAMDTRTRGDRVEGVDGPLVVDDLSAVVSPPSRPRHVGASQLSTRRLAVGARFANLGVGRKSEEGQVGVGRVDRGGGVAVGALGVVRPRPAHDVLPRIPPEHATDGLAVAVPQLLTSDSTPDRAPDQTGASPWPWEVEPHHRVSGGPHEIPNGAVVAVDYPAAMSLNSAATRRRNSSPGSSVQPAWWNTASSSMWGTPKTAAS